MAESHGVSERVSSIYLAALFQLLLHLLGWHVHVDDEVRRQELADANVLHLVVVLHTCEPQDTIFKTNNSWATVCFSLIAA